MKKCRWIIPLLLLVGMSARADKLENVTMEGTAHCETAICPSGEPYNPNDFILVQSSFAWDFTTNEVVPGSASGSGSGVFGPWTFQGYTDTTNPHFMLADEAGDTAALFPLSFPFPVPDLDIPTPSNWEFAELSVTCATAACQQGFFGGLWYSAVSSVGPPYDSPVPTPEPGVLALLLSGLLAVAAWWNWSQVAGNRGSKVTR